jgi:hypothetical protein
MSMSIPFLPLHQHTAPLRSIRRPRRWPSTVGSLVLGLVGTLALIWLA